MCLAVVGLWAGTPGVRDLRTHQHEISVFVRGDIVTDKPLPSAIQRQGQLVLHVVMPLKQDALELAVEENPRCVAG